MPDIELTESQLAEIDALREDIEAAFVDTYGHVRRRDVVDYLLDTYTPPGERETSAPYERIEAAGYPELQHIAAETPGVPGSGIDADEMRGRLLSELGAEELATRLDENGEVESESGADAQGDSKRDGASDGDSSGNAASDDESHPDEIPEIESEADANGAGRSDDAAETDDDEAGTGDDNEAGTDEEEAEMDSGGSSTSSGSGGGGGILASANQLLEQHDDKWRKDDSGDEPFEVTLPDGTSERVRTRDDVRKLLFQHY